MTGDYSKRPFDPNKDYADVLLQQGRVQLDSDWNEGVEIRGRRGRATTHDLVGRCGVPQETLGGFQIVFVAADNDLTIGKGRIYVDGLLAENHGAEPTAFDPILAETQGTAPIPYKDQPYYPTPDDPVILPTADQVHLVYLDVWEREVTHLQDPTLVEQAIAVDTTARLQIVWQVRILQSVADNVGCGLSDDQINGWATLIRPSAGRLTTDKSAVTEATDPCLIPPGGGYRGLENRLYRVEIHRIAADGTVKFKYSRDNGAVAAAVTEIVIEISTDRTQITLDLIGRDKVMRFREKDWIEVLDDHVEFRQSAGFMAQIIKAGDRTLTLDRALPAGELDPSKAERHTRVRRWDQGQIPGQIVDGDGLMDVKDDAIELEDGIVIQFNLDPDIEDGEYKVGDYWLFAARTADGSVEKLQQAPPRGIHHHYCRLALLSRDESGILVHDSRRLFPPLNTEPLLQYVGGDGQEANPNGKLPQPLEVAVFNGQLPVVGAIVQFEILAGSGGRLESGSEAGTTIRVRTNSVGVAGCIWTLETAPANPTPSRSQVVEAALLGADCEPTHPRIRFNGSLSNISLRYVSGDGQEAPAHEFVPARLRVGVEDGIGRSLEGVKIRFTVTQGDGRIRPVGGPLATTFTTASDPQGLAESEWRLGIDPNVVNLVSVEPVNPPQGTFLPVIFRAVIQQAVAGGGTCTVTLGVDGVNDLNEAVDRLPPEGGCICIPSREFAQEKIVDLTGRKRVTFEGCGPASIINFKPPQSERALFFVNEASDIQFCNFTANGSNQAQSLIEIGNVRGCEVRDCSLNASSVGIRSERSQQTISDLVIKNCRISAGRTCILLLTEGGRIERLLVHRNQLNAVEGVRTRAAKFVSCEVSDNLVIAKSLGLGLEGDDLIVSRNQILSSGNGFAVDIFVDSEDASIRIVDNTILAAAGSGLNYHGSPGHLILSGNRTEVQHAALVVHRLASDGLGTAQIEGNFFTSRGESDASVVECGAVDSPGTTLLHHMIFSSNRVSSDRLTLEERPTIYLNSRTLISTNNLVQEPDRMQFTSIRTPVEPRPLGIMAHNVTTSGVTAVNGHTVHNLP